MKKIIALSLCLLMLLPAVLVGCAKEEATVKFGSGLYVTKFAATNATADGNGKGSFDVTFAALTVDKDGKIAAAELDTTQIAVAYTADGKAVANDGFKTKYELGNDYNMVAYGKAQNEWYVQADNFEKLIVGKTLAEVKALVAEGNKGTDEVVNAGCSIMINEFVGAIEKAFAAATVEVAADATLKLSVSTEQSCTDYSVADDGKVQKGSNKVSSYVFASAVDKDGKIVAASSDCVEVDFTFDEKGASTVDTTKSVLSKKELGDNYNMKKYGGSAKEWYEQAAAFDAACIGKTKTEIAGLQATDGKGIDTLKAAGCTIYVTGFVKAATK